MPLPQISPDGTSMLIAFGEDPDANGTPARSTLYMVDITDGSARDSVTFIDRYPVATFSADGKWIAVIGGSDITLYETNDPTSTFSIKDAIPRNHFPFAAG